MSNKDNYIIFNPEGGLGKIIASTAVVRSIKQQYPNHKIVVITPWPEVYLNNPNVYRVFRSGNTPYFYKDYIKDGYRSLKRFDFNENCKKYFYLIQKNL